MNQISALKVGCGKFFHGKNVLPLLPAEIQSLGGKALLIGGPASLKTFFSFVQKNLDNSNITFETIEFQGECTTERADEYASHALKNGYTVFVAVGGGKCIDTVKCASKFSGLPIITIPTSVATCVATSMIAIMYNSEGQRDISVTLNKEIDVCIADRDSIATAPLHTLAAGILDSLAKYPESLHQKQGVSYTNCNLRENIQIINAKGIYDFLLSNYSDIYNNYHACTLLDDIILTNLLHTSIVSGFADGSGQLAVAHATYDFIRTYNTRKSSRFLHGEIVAVGLLAQMHFNGFSTECIEKIRCAMKEMKIPCTLKELNYETTVESFEFYLNTITEKCNIHTELEKNRLRCSLKEIL